MDTEKLKAIIEDLDFSIAKLESFEHVGEIAEQLKELEKNLSGFKKINSKNFFISGLVGLFLGGLFGYLGVYMYGNYKAKAYQAFGMTTTEDEANYYLQLKKSDLSSHDSTYVVFKKNKKG